MKLFSPQAALTHFTSMSTLLGWTLNRSEKVNDVGSITTTAEPTSWKHQSQVRWTGKQMVTGLWCLSCEIKPELQTASSDQNTCYKKKKVLFFLSCS